MMGLQSRTQYKSRSRRAPADTHTHARTHTHTHTHMHTPHTHTRPHKNHHQRWGHPAARSRGRRPERDNKRLARHHRLRGRERHRLKRLLRKAVGLRHGLLHMVGGSQEQERAERSRCSHRFEVFDAETVSELSKAAFCEEPRRSREAMPGGLGRSPSGRMVWSPPAVRTHPCCPRVPPPRARPAAAALARSQQATCGRVAPCWHSWVCWQQPRCWQASALSSRPRGPTASSWPQIHRTPLPVADRYLVVSFGLRSLHVWRRVEKRCLQC